MTPSMVNITSNPKHLLGNCTLPQDILGKSAIAPNLAITLALICGAL